MYRWDCVIADKNVTPNFIAGSQKISKFAIQNLPQNCLVILRAEFGQCGATNCRGLCVTFGFLGEDVLLR